MSFRYDVPRGENELERFVQLLTQCFGPPSPEQRPYIDRVGRDNLRIMRDGGHVAATLAMLPMGQWFGGASVPCCGIAAVGVAPEQRGGGLARQIMAEAMRELHARHTPLSALFPATQPIYRAVGFEQAGDTFDVRIPLRSITVRDRSLRVQPLKEAEAPSLRALYRAEAPRRSGWLDRSETIWERAHRPWGGGARHYAIVGDAGTEGYVVLQRRPVRMNHHDLAIADMLARTPAAARRLLTFFADHGSLDEAVTFRGYPSHPLLMLLAEQSYSVSLTDQWMLRLVDVPLALSMRGYPQHVTAELHLDVTDPLLDENNGRFVLRVADGKGTAERGGEGSVAIDVRGLAALYSGHRTLADVRLVGLAAGAAHDDAATALFAGTPPSMVDHF